MVSDGSAARSRPCCWAVQASSSASGGTICPRRYPASMDAPPVGSASTSTVGRPRDSAHPRAVVVTPGEPEAEVSVMTAISVALAAVQHQRGPTRGGPLRDLCRVLLRDQDRDHRLRRLHGGGHADNLGTEAGAGAA